MSIYKNDINLEFKGSRLLEFRKMSGMTQAQLAQYLDISQNQISKFERENHFPTAENLVKLAHLFDTTIDYLVGLSNIPHREAEPEPDITTDERELIALFNKRTRDERQQALRILHALWND